MGTAFVGRYNTEAFFSGQYGYMMKTDVMNGLGGNALKRKESM